MTYDTPSYGVSRLVIRSYRLFHNMTWKLNPQRPVILYGQNGSGKTTILEALSLFGGGRGLRGDHLADMVHDPRRSHIHSTSSKDKQEPAFDTSKTDHEPHFAGVGGNSAIDEASGMAILSGFHLRLDYGQNPDEFQLHYSHSAGLKAMRQGRVSSRKDIHARLPTLWLTPWYAYRFLTSSATRLRTLDRVVDMVNPDHTRRVNHLQRHIQARFLVLRQRVPDRTYLETIEREIAQKLTVTVADRLILVDQLRPYLQRVEGLFSQADLCLTGLAPDYLAQWDAKRVEDEFCDIMAKHRSEDAEKCTLHGSPHRPVLSLVERERKLDVAYVSTGEQHALLFTFLYSLIRFYLDQVSGTPLVLLDDVFSHLDRKRRASIQCHLSEMPICLWMSGVDEELFESIAGNSQPISLN